VLILDEPTNHLDVESIEALEDAFEGFDGTAIVVSHDRAFLRELATRVWAFDGNRIDEFTGPFVEWERYRSEREARRAAETSEREAADRAATEGRSRKQQDAKRQNEQALRSAKREAARLEEEIHRLEADLIRLEQALADPALYEGREGARRAAELDRELRDTRSRLDEVMGTWAELQEQVEGGR
jgi:ATPase subunit of ABC transporter with duplicated ATPase domains